MKYNVYLSGSSSLNFKNFNDYDVEVITEIKPSPKEYKQITKEISKFDCFNNPKKSIDFHFHTLREKTLVLDVRQSVFWQWMIPIKEDLDKPTTLYGNILKDEKYKEFALYKIMNILNRPEFKDYSIYLISTVLLNESYILTKDILEKAEEIHDNKENFSYEDFWKPLKEQLCNKYFSIKE